MRLGATWIDKEYIQQFMYETLTRLFYLQRSIEVHYTPFTAEWQISGENVVWAKQRGRLFDLTDQPGQRL